MFQFELNFSKQEIAPQNRYVLLAGITLLTVVLRFYKLGDWSFWGDEMFTVGGREDGFNYSWTRTSLSMSLIQMTVKALGITEWNARLVPAIIGVISIPLLYLLVRRMFDPNVGLVAALLLAVSSWHIYWSQNARFYVALLLFYTLALLLFYLGLEEDRLWYFLASFVFLGLAVKERLLALFFVPVVVSYVLLLVLLPMPKPKGLQWRNLTLFFLPGLIILVGYFTKPYLLNLTGWMKGFGYANNNPVWVAAVVVYYVGVPTITAAGLGSLYFLIQKNRTVLFLTLAALIPLVIIMSMSLFHYTASRYVFLALTSWIILAGLAATELIQRSRGTVKILAAGLLIFLVSSALGENFLYYRYQNGNRDNWKAAFELVKAEKQPGDLVVSNNPELADFYMQEKTTSIRRTDLHILVANRQRVWFVEDSVTFETTALHSWLVNNTRLIKSLDVQARAQNFRMKVYLYEPTEKAHNLP